MHQAKKLTRTAMLLALTLVFQALRLIPAVGNMPYSTLIIGTLVNMCLCISVLTINEAAGLMIGLCAPVVAFIQGHLAFVALIPFVALGNSAFVICIYYLQKLNKYAAVAAASLAKWAVMFFGSKYLLQFFLHVDYAKLQALVTAFNLPQLITALAGGALALILCRLLPAGLKDN